jgi:small subunit ribosomal protein S1
MSGKQTFRRNRRHRARQRELEYENPVRGQIIPGEIIQVEEDSVLVDIGAKRDAIVPRADLDRLDDELLQSLHQGDEVPVYVMRTAKIGGDLLVSINRGLEQEDWNRAEEMLESGEAVDLEIIAQNKGGVVVRFGRLRGFVPNSHIPDLRRDGDKEKLHEQKETMIGDSLMVKVIEVNQKRRRLVLSGRAARQERRRHRLKELDPGSTVTGTVVNLVDFGAFVDLGGVDGLIHISELEWSRVEHPSEVLKVGEEVEVEITKVEVERERVSLSRKNLMPSPWDSITGRYSAGDLIEGEITNVRDFGAFVMLPEGIEGLIHLSEIGIIGPGSPGDVVHPSDKVLARIIEIDPDRQRISLSLSRVSKDEQLNWLENRAEEAPEVELVEEDEGEPTDFDAELEAELSRRMGEEPTPESDTTLATAEVEGLTEAVVEGEAATEAVALDDEEVSPTSEAYAEVTTEEEPEAQREGMAAIEEPDEEESTPDLEAEAEVAAEDKMEAQPQAVAEMEDPGDSTPEDTD